MKILKIVAVTACLVTLTACSSGIQVIQKPLKADRLAIIMFEDCTGRQDCPGSGKKISDIYSKTLNAPVLMFAEDAKDFDIILTGRVLDYNEAIPMAFNPNIVGVDLKLNSIKNNSILITQKKVKTGSNITSSAKGLAEDLVDDFKQAMD